VIGVVLAVVIATLVAAAPTAKPQSAGAATAATTRQPDIVLILTDDQRCDTLWAMLTVESQLVAKGIEFTNGFVSNPLCCPRRSSILTGEYSHSTGVYTNQPDQPHGGFQLSTMTRPSPLGCRAPATALGCSASTWTHTRARTSRRGGLVGSSPMTRAVTTTTWLPPMEASSSSSCSCATHVHRASRSASGEMRDATSGPLRAGGRVSSMGPRRAEPR